MPRSYPAEAPLQACPGAPALQTTAPNKVWTTDRKTLKFKTLDGTYRCDSAAPLHSWRVSLFIRITPRRAASMLTSDGDSV